MANTQAMCTSFKREIMAGVHALGMTVSRGSTAADSLKAALYNTSATVNAATTVYSSTGEASGSGYTAGGIAVPNATAPTTSGTTGFWTPSGSLVYSGVSIGPVDAVLLYNSTQGNAAMSVHTFAQQTLVAGTLTLTMPTNDATNAVLRIA